MNKKELEKHLNDDLNIPISENTLRKVLKAIGLSKLRQYGQSDIEQIVKAIGMIRDEGGTDEAYNKTALLLGGAAPAAPPPTPRKNLKKPSPKSSASSNTETAATKPTPDRHNTLHELLDEKVSSYVGEVVRQKAADFLNSSEGFEYFADIITEELVGAFDNSFEGWQVQDLRQMRNVTPRTLEIEGQSVGGLPLSEEPDTDGADFHSYTDSDSGSDPDSAHPEDNGGSGE